MSIYGQSPMGVIVNSWTLQNTSGTYFDPYRYPILEKDEQIEFIQSSLDLSTVVCEYCGSHYLSEHIKSMKITRCLGCGAAKFHFERT